jgi:hypothetical protein
MTTQTITSAKTSIKQVPAIFKKVDFLFGTNLDLGGGKYDEVQAYFDSQGYECQNLVYDPFNRSEEHNQAVLDKAEWEGCDTVTISNVLNVIESKEHRLELLKLAAQQHCPVYITVYEGNKSGVGKQTTKGYQLNRKLKDYESEIKEVFRVVKREGGYITAYN